MGFLILVFHGVIISIFLESIFKIWVIDFGTKERDVESVRKWEVNFLSYNVTARTTL